MKRLVFLVLISFISVGAFAKKVKTQYVEVRTGFGVCVVKLYDETPLHKENFLKLVKDKFYEDLLFHRIIEKFMIQGGDLNSKNAASGAMLGDGDIGYTIPAEFRDNLFHKKGALAAARDNNPEKASSGSQFYIVQGKIFTDDELNRLEQGRLKGRKIPENQRQIYKTLGGVPHLDQDYTVYGEVVTGIEVIDKVAGVPTDRSDRPVVDQKMEMRVLRRGEVRRLVKELKKLETAS